MSISPRENSNENLFTVLFVNLNPVLLNTSHFPAALLAHMFTAFQRVEFCPPPNARLRSLTASPLSIAAKTAKCYRGNTTMGIGHITAVRVLIVEIRQWE